MPLPELANCPICQFPADPSEYNYYLISCGHEHHIECIAMQYLREPEWNEHPSRCSICRQRFTLIHTDEELRNIAEDRYDNEQLRALAARANQAALENLNRQESWYEYFCSFMPDLSSLAFWRSNEIETEDVFLEDISFCTGLCTDLSLIAATIFLIYVFELIFDFLFNLEPGIRFD